MPTRSFGDAILAAVGVIAGASALVTALLSQLPPERMPRELWEGTTLHFAGICLLVAVIGLGCAYRDKLIGD